MLVRDPAADADDQAAALGVWLRADAAEAGAVDAHTDAKHTPPVAGARFVPARRIGVDLWLSGKLRVVVDVGAHDWAVEPARAQSFLPPPHLPPPRLPPPRLPLCPLGWRSLVAWAFHVVVLLSASCALVTVLLSMLLQPEELEASSLSRESWYAAFHSALLVSILLSLLAVDGAKVLLLTALSMPQVDGALRNGHRSRAYLREPLRKLHLFLDVLLAG